MGGLRNHKLKPCDSNELSLTKYVIHTDGLFSGKMKDALNGGLEHINLSYLAIQ